MRLLVKPLLLAAAIIATAYFIPQIHVNSVGTAIGLVIVLAVLNWFIKPLLILLTIPITIVTLGLFLLVINTIIVLLADWMLAGFHIESLGWAFIFSILLSLFNYLIDRLLEKEETK